MFTIVLLTPLPLAVNMRNIALLLALTMLLGSLVGCLGGDDDDGSPLVGTWYYVDDMVIDIKEDGSAVNTEGTGTWSTDGDTITFTFDDVPDEYTFAIIEDWLWLMNDDCLPLAPETIDQDEWDDRVSEQTAPAMCE